MFISDREEQIDEFRQLPEVNVVLIRLRSVDTGVILTVLSHVTLAEEWWNQAVKEQAIGCVAAHRTSLLGARDAVQNEVDGG